MRGRPKTIIDPDGIEYPSVQAMCLNHGTTTKLYYKRRSYGMSMREALDPAPRKRYKSEETQDHLGNPYPSIRAMCRAHGVSVTLYCQRIKRGWDKESALTIKQDARNKPVTAPDGTEYKNFKAMCAGENADPKTVYWHMSRGKDLGSALELAASNTASYACQDHEDNTYRSQTDMCKAWGINPATYFSRRSRGMSVQEALTADLETGHDTADMLGGEYPSVLAMCADWHVNPKTYKYHVEQGHADALERSCAAAWVDSDAGAYKILSCVAFPWFLCVPATDDHPEIHMGEIMLHAKDIKDLKNQA